MWWRCGGSKHRQANRRKWTGVISGPHRRRRRTHAMWGFTITLGYSRRMMAEAATDQKLGTLLRMHEAAFQEWGGVPEEILYDRMKTIWTGTDERGEIVWNAVFLDFARYWGFTPRLCRPYRAQTKGKIESGVKYVRRNFLCGLLGREPASLADLNAELRRWVAEVANQRVHGTTHEQVLIRWDEDQFAMQPVERTSSLSVPAMTSSARWRGMLTSRGRAAATRCPGNMRAKRFGCASTAAMWKSAMAPSASRCTRRLSAVIRWSRINEHHQGIPLGSPRTGKTLIHIQQSAPVVEQRPLAAYESLAMGGAR